MKEKVLEALSLAKKFYSEELEGNHEHTDEELIRYYDLEGDIEDEYQSPRGYIGWYGAICWLKDILKFEC
jgi:hypothetical protein